MENLVAPALFDPMREKSHFRISGPDNVCTVVLPRLCRQYANGRYQVQFEFLPWQSGVAELVERGQLDLVLRNDEGLLPSHFQLEKLYKENWICAVARDSHFGDRLSLKQYLSASHVVVSPYEGVQTIPDKQLAALGAKRSSCIRVPYFGVALQCLPGTELVLTLTGGSGVCYQKRPQVAAVKRRRIACVSFPHGMASQTQLRPATRMASWCDAINSRGSQFISKDCAGTAQLDMRIGTRKSASVY